METPTGRPSVDSGSLISVTSTIRAPSPDLCVLLTSSPHGVSGAGVPLAPRAPIPPRAGSQSPVRSRAGAGPSGSTFVGIAVRPVLLQGCHFVSASGTDGFPAGGPCGFAYVLSQAAIRAKVTTVPMTNPLTMQ